MALTVQVCGPIYRCMLGSLVSTPAVTVKSSPSLSSSPWSMSPWGLWPVTDLHFVIFYIQCCIYTHIVHTYSTAYTCSWVGRLLLKFLKTILSRCVSFWNKQFYLFTLKQEEIKMKTLAIINNQTKLEVTSCRGLALASNKGPCGCFIALPPNGVGRRMERKRENLWVGIRAV